MKRLLKISVTLLATALVVIGAFTAGVASQIKRDAVAAPHTLKALIAVTRCGDWSGTLAVTADGVIHDVSDVSQDALRVAAKNLAKGAAIDYDLQGDCGTAT